MQNTSSFKLAEWWEPIPSGKVLCTLCPRYCKIGKDQSGFCFVRKNIDGKLYSVGYGRPTGFAVDPIEKKPLNHFYPGSGILSFGTAGCNLGCKFCQNWSMSKAHVDDQNSMRVSPEGVVKIALKNKANSIAYTYNDPTIFGEYVIDISRIAREEGLKSVMVTAGYIDKKARVDVYKYIDAANVDLKAFNELFYRNLTLSNLNDVLDTLIWLKNETNVWIELTTLLIPGENDSSDEIKKMCEWILENLGDSVPIHFTAFHPDFKMNNKPPTSRETLKKSREIALSSGVKYCYIGNVSDKDGQTTFCPKCRTVLIERSWHTVYSNKIKNGLCFNCGENIEGFFE